jgi:hypothetical protein
MTRFRSAARFGAGIFALFFLLGCSGNKLTGVREYQQFTVEAATLVQAALKALEQVAARREPSPKSVAGFSREVQRLEVNSIPIRARAQAIQSRGDAYFVAWSESISKIKDSRVRQLADTHHAELEQSFGSITASSRKAGAAFRPFLENLTRLRAELESNPRAALTPSENNLIGMARENGEKVLQELAAINLQLDAITTMLTPARTAAPS